MAGIQLDPFKVVWHQRLFVVELHHDLVCVAQCCTQQSALNYDYLAL